MKVPVNDIRERNIALFCAAGVSKEDAAILTDVLLEQKCAVFSHTVSTVFPSMLNCLKSGGISSKCDLTITSETPAWAMAEKPLTLLLTKQAVH